jgi:hypothetical protein
MVDPDNPEHATLGQVARMHVDPVSWLNQVSGVGTIRTRQAAISMPPVTTCSCPGIEPTNDCPAFNKDIERPGALSTPPLDPPACHVVPDRTCLPLTVGETGRITLNAYTDNMLASKGGGGGTVASLSPGLASVTKPKGGEATGFVQADVTALAAGDASVLIGYGGNLVTIPVKIGSACP